MISYLHLLRTKWRILFNSFRRSPRGWERLLLFLVLGLVFCAGIWGVSFWFFSKCLLVEPIGEVVVRRMLGMTLLVLFSLLGFSNLVGAFSTLYLAEDLQLLVPRPLQLSSLYAARFTETSTYASWMIGIFSLPIFIAAGQLFHAEAGYYAVLAVVFLTLAIIPTSLGVAVSLLLTSVLSARRARHVMVVAGTIALGVLVFVLRSLEPERFMNPDQRAPILEALQTLQGADAAWMPSTWALDALWPYLGFGANPDSHPLLLLTATAAMSFFVCGWLFRALYRRAYSRAQEGLDHGTGNSRGGRVRSRALAGRPEARLQLASGLRKKDRLVFIRDSAQWSQLLLLAAIVAIYVLNFKYIRVVTGVGLVSELGLHFLNLALTGFVCLALCARFVFPAVSLEGPAFWLVRSSPNPVIDFLRAKASSWALPMVLFACLLMVTTHMFIRTTTLLQLASILTITPLVLGLVRLGTGLGARYPRFKINNAAEIATGLGGILFMLIGATLLVVVVLSSILPTATIARWVERGRAPGARLAVMAAFSALLAVTAPLAVGGWALRSGTRSLDSSED